MGLKELTSHEVAKLLGKVKKPNLEEGTPIRVTEWPSIRNKRLLIAAIEDNEKVVTFDDGRSYSIKGLTNHIFVKPYRPIGFAPCGYFTLERLRDDVEDAERETV
jgi:hypothetical protein